MDESTNNTTQQRMTDEQIVASWPSSECPSCANPKSRLSTFCKSCTLALPIWVRNWLTAGPVEERYFVTFRAWHAHLDKWRGRIKRVGWDYKSLAEIEDAGYKVLNTSHCRAKGCGQAIGWLEDVCGNKLPINLADFQPHRTSCRNPGSFVQASAQRKRRRG